MIGTSVHKLKRIAQDTVFFGFLLSTLFVFLLPLAWMVLSSLKTQIQNTAYPPLILFAPTLENYVRVLTETQFFEHFRDSVIIASGSTLTGLIVGVPAAFAIARRRQQWVALGILIARIMPGIGYALPWFMVFSQIGWMGSHKAVILAHFTITCQSSSGL